jgi:TonB family protein
VKVLFGRVHVCRSARLFCAAAVLLLPLPWASRGNAQTPEGNNPARIRISADVAAGMLEETTPPIYPPIAKAARVEGTVVLEATISKAGAVVGARVISGHPMLQQAALDAVKTWHYQPYLLNGEPIEVVAAVNVTFALSGQSGDDSASGAQTAAATGSTTEGAPQAAPATAGQPSADAASMQGETFRVGGVSIALPPPTGEMVEIGGDHRVLFDMVVPDMNRLVAAFLLQKDAAVMLSTNRSGPLSSYALVEVLRRGEFVEIGSSDFKGLTSQMGQQFSAIANSSAQETQDEFNRRMKSMHLDEKLDYGKPVMLGALFNKTDACGFGMMAPVSMNGKSLKMIVGVIFVRVRSHVLFAYLYSAYKDQSTTEQVRTVSEQWADAILAANPE